MTKYGPYSPSRLEVARCPYRFRREYIDKDVPKEGSEAANRGAAVHRVLEWYMVTLLEKKTPNPLWVNKAIEEFPVKEPENLQFIRQAAENFLIKVYPYPLETVVGVEEFVAIDEAGKPCDYDDPKAMLRGKLDVLNIAGTMATIVDHKTQRNIETADTFQQGCYALMTKAAYPYLTQIDSVLHFCAPELNFYSNPATWDDLALLNLKLDMERFVAMAEAIDPKTEEACPGWHCRYCPIIDECPRQAEFTRDGAVKKPGPIGNDPKLAVKYAEHYIYLEQYFDALAKPLKEYCSRIGPVALSSAVAEYRTSHGYNTKGTAAIKKLLRDYKIDPEPFMRFDSKSIEAIEASVQNHPQKTEFLMALARVAPTTTTSRFGTFKKSKCAE